eukprot:4199535-Prymnesium_polylepis.1
MLSVAKAVKRHTKVLCCWESASRCGPNPRITINRHEAESHPPRPSPGCQQIPFIVHPAHA